MTTLGLDVSPLRIGWALLDKGKLKKHGTIQFDQAEWVTPSMRADAIEDTFDEIEVNRIGLEAVFVGPNKLGSIRAAMALGQIEAICDGYWPDSQQKVLTAAQWRRLAGIEGGGKAPVLEWATLVCKKAKVDAPAMQDAADAIAIAHAVDAWYAENE